MKRRAYKPGDQSHGGPRSVVASAPAAPVIDKIADLDPLCRKHAAAIPPYWRRRFEAAVKQLQTATGIPNKERAARQYNFVVDCLQTVARGLEDGAGKL